MFHQMKREWGVGGDGEKLRPDKTRVTAGGGGDGDKHPSISDAAEV